MSEAVELSEFDIEKAFAESFKDCAPAEQGPQRNCYPYSSFNACRFQGTLYGRIIPAESQGRMTIYKTLNNVLMGSIPFKSENSDKNYYRSVRVIESGSYDCELTDEQRKLNEDLINQINIYNNLMVEKGVTQWEPFKQKRVSIFYMMIRRFIDAEGNKNDYTDPNITCVFHTSFRFGEKFDSAVKKRTEAKESNSWLKDYFGRNPGMNDKFILMTTKRPTAAYETEFSFEDLPALKFEIKEDDLNSAVSLDEAFVNTKAYDLDFYKEIYNRLKELNAELDGGPSLVDAPPVDRTNHNME